ncbi:cupin domain-containing protein [Pseudoramibacter sp. HA2172]|uniref:cupin domain-containing protein n=1 Tax=Pseudoramibacter faecis TaxID=3108534 RepID=UPI002E7772A9|nr:cupin domain-containing protein [Pseudoramibacter sp. HA2172]
MNVTEALIADIVHRVMEAGDFLQGDQPFRKERDPSGITRIQVSTVKCEPFEGREDVRLKDVMTLEEAPRMGAGIMEVDHTDFEWTLSYDEYDIILEGTLEIVIDGRVVSGEAGDILYVPKGSHIHFRSPNKARFAYFVYPADWQ